VSIVAEGEPPMPHGLTDIGAAHTSVQWPAKYIIIAYIQAGT
jgi:hypothetical protein